MRRPELARVKSEAVHDFVRMMKAESLLGSLP